MEHYFNSKKNIIYNNRCAGSVCKEEKLSLNILDQFNQWNDDILQTWVMTQLRLPGNWGTANLFIHHKMTTEVLIIVKDLIPEDTNKREKNNKKIEK